jgi:hypothetical protein
VLDPVSVVDEESSQYWVSVQEIEYREVDVHHERLSSGERPVVDRTGPRATTLRGRLLKAN